MANPAILLKRSSISGKIPDSSDLSYGELALNYTDGVLYYKNSSNAIGAIAAGLDSDQVLSLVPFGIGYETSTITSRQLSSPFALLIDGVDFSSNNDAFGVSLRNIYDNMEPLGRIETVDLGAL